MNKGRCSGSIRDDYTTDNVTDADDEILESLVKTATRTPHTQARERKRNNRHTHADRSARKYHTTHFLLHLIISLFFFVKPTSFLIHSSACYLLFTCVIQLAIHSDKTIARNRKCLSYVRSFRILLRFIGFLKICSNWKMVRVKLIYECGHLFCVSRSLSCCCFYLSFCFSMTNLFASMLVQFKAIKTVQKHRVLKFDPNLNLEFLNLISK